MKNATTVRRTAVGMIAAVALACGGALAATPATAAPLGVKPAAFEIDLGLDLGALTTDQLEALLGTLTDAELADLIEELLGSGEFGDLGDLLGDLDPELLKPLLDGLSSGDLEDILEGAVESVENVLELLLGGLTEGQLEDLLGGLSNGQLEDLLGPDGLGSLLDDLGLGGLLDNLLGGLLGGNDVIGDLLDNLSLTEIIEGLIGSQSIGQLIGDIVDSLDIDVIIDELLGTIGSDDLLNILVEVLGQDFVDDLLDSLGVDTVVDVLNEIELLQNPPVLEQIINVINNENPETVSADVPTITGKVQYRQRVTVDPGEWDASTFTYQWKRNGVNIEGATGASYGLTVNDVNTRISVAVTGYKTDAEPATVMSGDSSPVAKATFSSTVKPGVLGSAKRGTTVKASTAFKKAYPGATFKYQWFDGSKPIAAAKAKKSYMSISKTSSIKKLRIQVTITRAGFVPITRTSAVVTVKR